MSRKHTVQTLRQKAIKAEAVRLEALRRNVEVVGTLTAQDEVTVSSQAESVVLRVLADLGDLVKAEQVLIELDSEKLRYNLDQQKASLGAFTHKIWRRLVRRFSSRKGHARSTAGAR